MPVLGKFQCSREVAPGWTGGAPSAIEDPARSALFTRPATLGLHASSQHIIHLDLNANEFELFLDTLLSRVDRTNAAYALRLVDNTQRHHAWRHYPRIDPLREVLTQDTI